MIPLNPLAQTILISVITGGVGAAIVSGVVTVIINRLNRHDEISDKMDAQNKAVEAALRMLLYNEIKRDAERHIQKGSISADDLHDIMEMHKVYHDSLHGNGFLDALMDSVKHLPIT